MKKETGRLKMRERSSRGTKKRNEQRQVCGTKGEDINEGGKSKKG